MAAPEASPTGEAFVFGLMLAQSGFHESPARLWEMRSSTSDRVWEEIMRDRWKTPPELWAKLKPLVREMRSNPTEAEKILWECLRGKQLGVKFRRQHPVGRFILDFYAPTAKLAVELDGGGHADPDQIVRDRERDAMLGGLGIRVVRVWNSEFLENPEGVLEAIWLAVHQPPSNSPRGRGEG